MNQNIANIAKSYNGQRELPGNMGFTNKGFEKKMIDVGFQKSWAWCALFMELCAKEGSPTFYKQYQKLFSASATTTYKNFDQIHLTSQTPEIGDGVIWRHGIGWQGHAGIVVAVDLVKNTITTVEGNTNSDGSREGIEVAIKTRKIKEKFKSNGLNLLGFIRFV